MRKVFQIKDELGNPRGGHVFEAPDQATLEDAISRSAMPEGWTREEVVDEAELVIPPAEEPPPIEEPAPAGPAE